MSSIKCKECNFITFANATTCEHCGAALPKTNLQTVPLGSVVTEDGYVLPPPPAVGPGFAVPGIWREKSTLVMDKNAVLPDRCVKCNEPALGGRLKRRLTWHHPALYLVILVGLLIYLIIAMIIRKSAKIEIGICEHHRKKRQMAILITCVLIALGLLFFFAAISWEDGTFALLGLLCLFGGVIYGLIGAKVVAPAKIDDRYVWLRGVNKDYLNELPSWPGY